MEVKVVTGANYGDEGKGMVSYALANEAVQKNKKVLTVFYNGGIQRAHTANDQILHCIGVILSVVLPITIKCLLLTLLLSG